MVNKSLRTISDGVRFSYSASLEVPCGAVRGIDYIQVRAVSPLVSLSKHC